ncbi:MAG: hypothetical protein JO344_05935 [Planctomycetaceae bacterium]|nr:hypothetical protein [Planctomycetaceae bacterium]
MVAIEGLTARVTVSIQDARVAIAGGQLDLDVPRIQVAIPREDCTALTRRMMPERFAFPAMEFGLGQRITGLVSNLRGVELDYEGNEIHFKAQPKYRVELHQHLPVLGWKRIAAISGKVDVPGLIRFRLDNPGAPLPEVGICYEIIPGVPNILNIPDWAETSFKPDGQTIRDKIRELLTRQELIRPFSRFADAAVLQQVRIQELTMSTDETCVRLDFAVVVQVEH